MNPSLQCRKLYRPVTGLVVLRLINPLSGVLPLGPQSIVGYAGTKDPAERSLMGPPGMSRCRSWRDIRHIYLHKGTKELDLLKDRVI